MLSDFELDGWDRVDDETHVTFIREDRLAKLTVKPVVLADYDSGWLAKLWAKDSPHGRSRFVRSTVHPDPEAFRAMVRGLALEAP